MAFVPESRRMMLFAAEPVLKNVTIAILDRMHRLWLDRAPSAPIARRHVARLHIRPRSVDRLLGHALRRQPAESGAGEVAHAPAARAGAQRTDPRHGRGRQGRRGEDRADLREQGIGIVVVSTEPETVLSLADRILVMKRGRVIREFADEPVSKDRLLAAA